MTEITLLMGLWLLWGVSWVVAALWAAPAEKRPPLREEALYRGLAVIAALLIFWRPGDAGLLWVIDPVADWILVGVTAAGLAFTWWARIHLGELWSGDITRKAGHHIVDTGPYRIVRHPIYTGLLIAFYATALHRGTALALAGAALATAGLYVKARLEERFLSAELGPAYRSYSRRVPMLVPFLPTRG